MAYKKKKEISQYFNTDPKGLIYVSAFLTLLYAIGAPIWDFNYRMSNLIGPYFLDAQHNTTTFDNYFYFIAYIPVVVFASLWSLGVWLWTAEEDKSKRAKATAASASFVIIGGSLALYFVLSFVFGFMYHF